MSRRLRGVVAMVAGMVAAALLASPASACSCAGIENPRAALAEAPGAFVGVLEEVTRGGSGNDAGAEFHFRVEHAVKGEIGERIVVHSHGDGGACGLEGRPGDRLAMFLKRDAAHRWTGFLCQMISPERLLAAAQPLPAPDGQGPAALVLGAAIGEHRSVLLDAQGRTLAYGAGPEPNAGQVDAVDGCPGHRRVVEAMGSGYPASRALLAVRALEGFRIERTTAVADAIGGDPPTWRVGAVQCRDASAATIDVAVASWGSSGDSQTRVLRLADGRWRVVWQGDDASVLLSDDARSAVIKRQRRIERLDLDTGATTELAAVETYDTPTLTPDGSLLAVVTMEGFRPAQLLVLDARTGATKATHRFASEADGVAVQWVDDRHLAVLDYRARTLTFFDPALRMISTVGGWDAHLLLASGGRAYGASFESGMLLEATPRVNALRRMTVPDGVTRAVLAVPPPPRPKAATTTTTTATPVRAEVPVETVPPVPLPELPLPMAAPPPVVPASSTRPWAPAGAATVLLGAAVAAIALRHKSLMTQ